MQPFFLCLPSDFLYYNIREIAKQFLTLKGLKRSSQQSKSVILHLLQGCYNIREIAKQFLTYKG